VRRWISFSHGSPFLDLETAVSIALDHNEHVTG
jgi:hypothetical protein